MNRRGFFTKLALSAPIAAVTGALAAKAYADQIPNEPFKIVLQGGRDKLSAPKKSRLVSFDRYNENQPMKEVALTVGKDGNLYAKANDKWVSLT